MKNEIIVTQPDNIRITNGGEHSTMYHIVPAFALNMPKHSVDDYRNEAQLLLNGLSGDFNRIGIDGIIAALLIETLGNDNYGKENS